MSKKDEALKLALEAFEADASNENFLVLKHCVREALAEQPAQQQKEGFASPGGGYVPAIPRPIPLDWKLVPRKATPEMLRAMDECAQEGYDERLYAGMASSVYMAAWDASPVMGTLPEQPAQQSHCNDCGGFDPECPLAQPVQGCEFCSHPLYAGTKCKNCGREQPAQQQEPVAVLPDGSAFAVMSYPLPKDHWLYADRQYNDGEYEPVELGKPVLTHELRDAVVSAVRYAIRGATNCGKEVDFDPDALVQNAVYALCGPFTSTPPRKPWVGLTQQDIDIAFDDTQEGGGFDDFARAIEAKLKEKNNGTR